jgi:hypothetical protein
VELTFGVSGTGMAIDLVRTNAIETKAHSHQYVLLIVTQAKFEHPLAHES